MSIVGAAKHIPSLARGNKIFPQHLAGMLGLPYVGDVWYVDANNGNDSTNAGKSFDDAFATVSKAEDTASANNHDVILITPSATTGRTSETASITWDKDYLHLIGVTAPTMINPRAGMSAGASVSPLITISADGCIFANLTLASFNDNNDLVIVSGSRNRFDHVHFAGIGNATTGDDANGRVVTMSGGQENLFTNCTFGLDTVMRSTTNATLEFESSASRNEYHGCNFIMAADNVGPNHILFTGSSAIDRWVRFVDCHFYSFWTNDSDNITHAIDMAAQTATGHCLIQGNYSLTGADDWEATASGNVYIQRFGETAGTIGLTVNPTV